jgi:cytochrome c oxidase subunit IV
MATHVASQRLYVSVFAALLALTALTVGVSRLELGVWHTPVGLAIAACKATLVFLFFMHLLHSSRLTWLILAGALFFMGILFGLTLSDYLSRYPNPWAWPMPGK